MRHEWARWAGVGALLGATLLLGGCEDKLAKSEPIALPPYKNAGTLDTSFGGDGSVFAPTGVVAKVFGGGASAYSVTTDPAGNILAAGFVQNADNDFVVWRLNASGLLDFSFHGGSPAAFDAPTPTAAQTVRGIALQQDGNIVLAGSVDPGANIDPAVWRLFANGTGFDSTFNGTGYFNTAPPGNSAGIDIATGIAVDAAGRIVVAGISAQTGFGSDMAVWRFLPNGTLDGAFGTGGIYLTHAAGNQLGNALALDGTGNVYVAGSDDASGTQKLAVWKLLATNGTLDASFGTAGQYTHTGTPGADSGNAIAIDSAGRLVVAGSQFNGTDDDGVVIRLTPAGAADASFGTAGVVTVTDPAGGTAVQDAFNGIAIDAYGRIVVVGTGVDAAAHINMVLVRLMPAGGRDGAFGTTGVVTSNNASGAAGDDIGKAICIDNAGRIVVAGYTSAGTALAVWRYK